MTSEQTEQITSNQIKLGGCVLSTRVAGIIAAIILAPCLVIVAVGVLFDSDDDDESIAMAETVTPTATVAAEPEPTPTVEPEPTATSEPEFEPVIVRVESEAGTVRDLGGGTVPDAYAPIDLIWAEVWLEKDNDLIMVRLATDADIVWIDEANDSSKYSVILRSEEAGIVHAMDLSLRKYDTSHFHHIQDTDGHSIPGREHRHNWTSNIEGNTVTFTIDRLALGDFPTEFTWATRTSNRADTTESWGYADMLPQPRGLGMSIWDSYQPGNHAEYP